MDTRSQSGLVGTYNKLMIFFYPNESVQDLDGPYLKLLQACCFVKLLGWEQGRIKQIVSTIG